MKNYFKICVFYVLVTSMLVTGCTFRNSNGSVKVHFIDVGQADCILIESNDKYMLVDGGNNEDAELIVSYLQKEGVSRLEYVIGTHPHEDHIGSLDVIINKFDIGKVIMPPVTNNTKTFEDVLDAIERKGLKITKPVVGTSFALDEAEFTILAPNKDYDDNLNNWSVGIKLTYNNNRFVLCGDVEKEAERDILGNKLDIRADVLKANHHGSETSNSPEFLDAVSPDYVVITSEKGNSYGHPHKEVLEKLKEREIEIYRTDTQGTIIATSDGSKITWSTKPSDNSNDGNTELMNDEKGDNKTTDIKEDSKKEITYILNTNSKKFHYENCNSVANMSEKNKKQINISRNELLKEGFEPCGICNP